MDNSKLNVLVVEPEKAPYVKEIDSGLESLQAEVGGFIEALYPYEDAVAIVCNEEGKLNGLPLNRALRDEDGHPFEIVAGTFLITGLGEEDFCSLAPEQQEKYSKLFQTPEMFLKLNGKLLILPMEAPREKKTSIKEQLTQTSSQGKKKSAVKHHSKEER